MLTCLVPVLFTFYIQSRLKLKKNNSGAKGLITVQRDATKSSLFIILQVHSTCFGCQPHPSSGLHKTATTASGTGHIFCAATSLVQASLAKGGSCTSTWPREVAAQVLEAVVTVLCTPENGCG
jgi:hypothetical protein